LCKVANRETNNDDYTSSLVEVKKQKTVPLIVRIRRKKTKGGPADQQHLEIATKTEESS